MFLVFCRAGVSELSACLFPAPAHNPLPSFCVASRTNAWNYAGPCVLGWWTCATPDGMPTMPPLLSFFVSASSAGLLSAACRSYPIPPNLDGLGSRAITNHRTPSPPRVPHLASRTSPDVRTAYSDLSNASTYGVRHPRLRHLVFCIWPWLRSLGSRGPALSPSNRATRPYTGFFHALFPHHSPRLAPVNRPTSHPSISQTLFPSPLATAFETHGRTSWAHLPLIRLLHPKKKNISSALAHAFVDTSTWARTRAWWATS